MQALSSRRTFWWLWSTLFLVKVLLAARMPLFGDEAWYWLEAQHPDFAYSDLPGLTAWLVRLGVELGGHSLLGLRWPFLLLGMAVPLLVQRCARRVAGGRDSWSAATLSLLLPLLGAQGLLAVPDVPLTFAAALCLLALLRLARGERAALILAVGLIVGALSHYRFLLLIAAGFLALLLDRDARSALRMPRVWLAIGAGASAWLPLLLWNLQHADAGWRFQLVDRHPGALHAEGLWMLPAQVLVVTPPLLILLLASLWCCARRWRRTESGPWGVLLAASAVPLLTYLLLAFVADRDRVSFHWMLQAYLPLLLVAPVVLRRVRAWAAAIVVAFAALGLLSILGYASLASSPALRARSAATALYPDNFSGWQEVSEALRDRGVRGADDVIAGDFMLGAQLAFAFAAPRIAIHDHPLNLKHGRQAQLVLWRERGALRDVEGGQRWLAIEDSAINLRYRLDYYFGLCARWPGLASPEVVQVDQGRKRFLLFDLAARRSGGCVLPALAWIDTPEAGATVGPAFTVAGWAFKDGAGIARVELTIDGEAVGEAQYGLPAAHVAEYWQSSRDRRHPDVGFRYRMQLEHALPGRHWLGLRLHGQDGSIEAWPAQPIELRFEP